MKITGIITEYNPFHKGHAYQIARAKEISDAVVCVMSGNFVQRGDVAVFDKWTRAKAALSNGADLVLELPTVFALSSAERFAFGGVSTLEQMGCIDYLMFGSECGDAKILQNAAKALENEPKEVSEKIKKYTKEGMGYPAARERAFEGIIPKEILSMPNNILAVEYIRQLLRASSKIVPVTHTRIGAGHNEGDFKADFPCASAIREEILKNGYEYDGFEGCCVHRSEKLDSAILYHIRKNGENAFCDIFDCSKELANRIVGAAKSVSNFAELVELSVSKQYTASKIRRVVLGAMIGITAKSVTKAPDYIRVLGASRRGFAILKEVKNNSNLKIITKTADFKEENYMFQRDILATDIYDLTSDFPTGAGEDYKKSPVMGGTYE